MNWKCSRYHSRKYWEKCVAPFNKGARVVQWCLVPGNMARYHRSEIVEFFAGVSFFIQYCGRFVFEAFYCAFIAWYLESNLCLVCFVSLIDSLQIGSVIRIQNIEPMSSSWINVVMEWNSTRSKKPFGFKKNIYNTCIFITYVFKWFNHRQQ